MPAKIYDESLRAKRFSMCLKEQYRQKLLYISDYYNRKGMTGRRDMNVSACLRLLIEEKYKEITMKRVCEK